MLDCKVQGVDNKKDVAMNTETEVMINLLIRLFNERETVWERSKEYAMLTMDILWIENALISRGVDTAAILLPLLVDNPLR